MRYLSTSLDVSVQTNDIMLTCGSTTAHNRISMYVSSYLNLRVILLQEIHGALYKAVQRRTCTDSVEGLTNAAFISNCVSRTKYINSVAKSVMYVNMYG